MLQEKIILPAVGADVPAKALYALSHAIERLPGATALLMDEGWRTAADVVATHVKAGNLPDSLHVHRDGSVEDSIAAIRNHGIALGDAWLFWEHKGARWFSPRYRAGPGIVDLFNIGDRGQPIDDLTIVLFQFDPQEPPFVVAGEGTCPPRVPGECDAREDFAPFGDYTDFIGAAFTDIRAQWTHPDTGRHYGILDLDWESGLGIGWSFIQFEGGSGRELKTFADAVGKVCGQRMMYAHRHL